MSQATAIEWTDVSWNPVHGCSKVSPGCAHCYAETLSRRYGQTPKPWTPANAAENVILKPHKLREPLSWRKPRMVFVNSMSDLFHELVPDEYIAEVFGVMAAAPQHTFQVLTKRPERMRALLDRSIHSTFWRAVWDHASGVNAHETAPVLLLDDRWTLTNVWLGVSIENRRFVDRADVLRQTPAAVRFISAEPLLGPLVSRTVCPGASGDCLADPEACMCGNPPLIYGAEPWSIDLHGIDWLIVGGESGPGHRRLNLEWARDLRDACRRSDAGTAFFVKQLGGARPGTKLEDLPEDLRTREFPRQAVRA